MKSVTMSIVAEFTPCGLTVLLPPQLTLSSLGSTAQILSCRKTIHCMLTRSLKETDSPILDNSSMLFGVLKNTRHGSIIYT